jgi:hypothetical protein
MADPIQIVLQAVGVQQLQSTFRSVEQSIIAMERNILAASERGTRTRTSLVQREGADKEKAFAKVAKEAEKWERERVRSAEKTAKDVATVADKSGREQVRAFEKAEREKQAAADKTAAYLQGVRNRSAAMAGAAIMREADREIREAKRVYDARVQFARSMGGNITGSISGAMHGIVGAGRGIMAGALNVGGGFSVADSVQREVALRGTAATISASSMPGANGKKMTSTALLASARGTANAYGMNPEEVLKGIGNFKDLTGDLGRGVALAPQIAKLATAMGADTGDLMTNAGNIAMSSPKMSNDDIMRLVRVQTKQGMEGAVEVKDLAKYGGRLTAGASLFGGDRATNIATLGAFSQVARQHGGAASPAEATLAAQRFATDVAKHHKGIEATGIKVSDGKGNLRAADEIMKDMLKKSGGDVLKFGQFGLGERGNKVLTGFADIYKQGGGGKAGEAAVNKELAKYTSGISDADIDQAAKERLAEADKQVTTAMNQLRDAVGKELLPEFVKLIGILQQNTPQIAAALKHVVRFAEWFANNPMKGLGAIVLAKITTDLGKAAIGEGVKQVLMRLIAGAGGGASPVPGAAGGAAGTVLKAIGGGGAAAGGAVVAGAIGQGALIGKFGLETGGAILGGQEQGQNIAAMLASADPSKRTEGEKLLATARAKAGGAGAAGAAGGERIVTALTTLANPLGAGVNAGVGAAVSAAGGKSNGDRSLETIEARETVRTVELVKALNANTTATTANTAHASASPAGTPASANSPTTTLPLSARP